MTAFDPTKVKTRATYNHPGTLYSLAFDPTRNRLYAGGDDSAVHVFGLAAEKKEAVARWSKHDNYVSAVVRVDAGLVVSGSYDRRLIWWDAERGEPIRTIEAHEGWVRDLVATPDGERLVSAGDDMLVKVWDTVTGRVVRALDGHAKQTPQGHVTALYAVAVSPDGKFLASADRAGAVRVWETETGRLVQGFDVPVLYTYDPRQRKRSMGGIRALAFAPDGRHLAASGIGQVGNVDGLAGPAHVEVWDWQAPRQVFAGGAEGHKGLVNHLQFHPDGWLIGAGGGSDGGFLAFWKWAPTQGAAAPAGKRLKTDGHVHRFALNAVGTELYAAGYRKLTVWTLANSA
jgi:WD40 repeat protein